MGLRYQSENFNGSYDFRCRIHDGWLIESHLHEYSEFLYCQKGQGCVVINGEMIPLHEKQLVWIPPNYIHRYDCPDAVVICAVYSNDYIPLFFHKTKDKRLKASAIDISDMSDILEKFYTFKKEDLLSISGYLNLIGSRVLAQSQFESVQQSDGVLYQRVISYLSEHFSEDISLKIIAKTFGYNEKYLSHALHQLTGFHFSKLVSLYRIQHARKLLLTQKNTNISKIAQDSGFSAVNTFNRVFRETMGMTPSQYRKTASQF